MIRLIGYEFGKIVRRKIVYAALGALAVFSLMLYMGNGPQSAISRLPDGTYIGGGEAVAYDKEVAAEYEGELTEEKIQDILERYAPGTSDGGFWTINSTYNTVQNSFGNMDGSYNGLTVEEAFPDYQGEKPLLLGYSSGYTGFIIMGMYLMTGFGFVLIIALAPVFSEEYSRKTDALLLTSRHGKRLCGWSKILAAYLFTLLTAGVFLLIMIGAFLAGFGLTGGESSIQLNDSFLLEDVPYFMSCMDAALDCLVLWLAGALILTALTLVLSALCRTSFLTLIAALAVYMLPMLGVSVGIPDEILSVTPFWCFLSERTLEIPKFFGGQLSWIWIPAAFSVLLAPLALHLGRKIFARHQVA